MSTLYIVSKLLKKEDIDFLIAADTNDSVIYIGDGVYNLIHSDILFFKNSFKGSSHYLNDDTDARGLKIALEEFIKADYKKFVELTTQHTKIISWY